MANSKTVLHLQIPDYKLLIGEKNETRTLHDTVIASLSEKYQGEILKSLDGISYFIFAQPENAIQFSLNITNRFHQTPKIPFKIGIIHPINYENGHNEDLATSLSNACPDGAVLVSRRVVEVLGSNKDYSFVHIGSSLFKGANQPTEIYALAGSGLYIPSQNELNLGTKNKNSIAILPFHNTSSEKELDYICDGIAEEIIDTLSKSKDLFVTARSSSFMFRNKELSILDISKKLNVNYVLDGSIRKRNEEYRISYQLVDCSTGFNLIADTLSADFKTLYDTEKNISKNVLDYFNNDENGIKPDSEDSFNVNPEAYSNYLQAKYLSSNWQVEYVQQAIKLFEKALEIAPNYALAFAGLSITHIHMAVNQFADAKESLNKAIAYADKAIAADNTVADGFIAKAIAGFWSGQWYVPDFETNITKALSLSPCNAEIRMFNGMLFLFKGEPARALSELLLAKQLDPHSVGINLRLGIVQYLNKNYEDAFNTFLSLPDSPKVKTYKFIRLAWCCIMLGQYTRAKEYLEQTQKDYEYYHMIYGIYLVIFKELKDESQFFHHKELIEQLSDEDPNKNYNKALLYKLLGNTTKSIEYLEKTLQNPLFMFTFLHYDEFWKEYHDHPLFQELITSKYKGTGNQFIKIESDTKEYIELPIKDFLFAEAQDNYSLIVYRSNNSKTDKILRITLSNIEKQLCYEQIIRCHRSYLINSSAGFTFHKADNKAYLKHPDFDISIPVSRAKEKEMKELLNR